MSLLLLFGAHPFKGAAGGRSTVVGNFPGRLNLAMGAAGVATSSASLGLAIRFKQSATATATSTGTTLSVPVTALAVGDLVVVAYAANYGPNTVTATGVTFSSPRSGLPFYYGKVTSAGATSVGVNWTAGTPMNVHVMVFANADVALDDAWSYSGNNVTNKPTVASGKDNFGNSFAPVSAGNLVVAVAQWNTSATLSSTGGGFTSTSADIGATTTLRSVAAWQVYGVKTSSPQAQWTLSATTTWQAQAIVIVPTQSAPPPAPTNLRAYHTNLGVTLTWDIVGGATAGYKVYDNGVLQTTVNGGNTTGASTQDSAATGGLVAGSTHSYTVRAVNAFGESSDSNVQNFIAATCPSWTTRNKYPATNPPTAVSTTQSLTQVGAGGEAYVLSVVIHDGTTTVTGVTGGGATWQRAGRQVNPAGTMAVELWYALGVAAGSATITATVSSSVFFNIDLAAVANVDSTEHFNTQSGDAIVSGTTIMLPISGVSTDGAMLIAVVGEADAQSGSPQSNSQAMPFSDNVMSDGGGFSSKTWFVQGLGAGADTRMGSGLAVLTVPNANWAAVSMVFTRAKVQLASAPAGAGGGSGSLSIGHSGVALASSSVGQAAGSAAIQVTRKVAGSAAGVATATQVLRLSVGLAAGKQLPTLDAVSTAKLDGVAGNSVSWSHTCASGAKALVVGIGTNGSSSGTTLPSSVTYGGVPLTFVGGRTPGTIGGETLWVLKNPPAGTAAIAVTMPVTQGYFIMCVAASFFTADGAMGAAANAFLPNSNAQAAITPPSSTGDLIIGAAYYRSGYTLVSGETDLGHILSASSPGEEMFSKPGGSGVSVSMAATSNGEFVAAALLGQYAVSGAASAAAALGRILRMAAASAGIATVTGSTGVRRSMAVSVHGGAAAAGAAAVTHTFAATATSAATTSGAATVSHTLVASAIGQGAATGATRVTRTLVASSSGAAVVAPVLRLTLALNSLATAVATTMADATVRSSGMSASVVGDGSGTGGLVVRLALTGAPVGVASSSGVVAMTRRLAGSPAGVATVGGPVGVTRTLAAGPAGVAACAVSTSVQRAMAGNSSAVATTSAGIRAIYYLQGAPAGVAGGTAALIKVRSLAGTSAGVAIGSSSVSVTHRFAASVGGRAAATVTVSRTLALAGSGAGVAVTLAGVGRLRLITGSGAGASSAGATAGVRRGVVAHADGASSLGAEMVFRINLGASALGLATAVAGASPVRGFTSLVDGVGRAIAYLYDALPIIDGHATRLVVRSLAPAQTLGVSGKRLVLEARGEGESVRALDRVMALRAL